MIIAYFNLLCVQPSNLVSNSNLYISCTGWEDLYVYMSQRVDRLMGARFRWA